MENSVKSIEQKKGNLYFLEVEIVNCDGSWWKFTWMERDCDFLFHHFCQLWNTWMNFSLCFMILSERLANFWAKIMEIECGLNFTVSNWSKMWIREMLSSMNFPWMWIEIVWKFSNLSEKSHDFITLYLLKNKRKTYNFTNLKISFEILPFYVKLWQKWYTLFHY